MSTPFGPPVQATAPRPLRLGFTPTPLMPRGIAPAAALVDVAPAPSATLPGGLGGLLAALIHELFGPTPVSPGGGGDARGAPDAPGGRAPGETLGIATEGGGMSPGDRLGRGLGGLVDLGLGAAQAALGGLSIAGSGGAAAALGGGAAIANGLGRIGRGLAGIIDAITGRETPVAIDPEAPERAPGYGETQPGDERSGAQVGAADRSGRGGGPTSDGPADLGPEGGPEHEGISEGGGGYADPGPSAPDPYGGPESAGGLSGGAGGSGPGNGGGIGPDQGPGGTDF